ncbi:Unconventional myosin-XVIIIa [Schistosoma japonicum]|nr:Unconventional myosin-XVIIIa [Schistosoma japonicum]
MNSAITLDTLDNSAFDAIHSIKCKTSNDEYVQSVYDEDNNQTDFPVWVTFKQGYVSGKFLSSLPNGRCRVIILPGQEIIEVNTEDVERANPPRFDRVDDLIKLRYINESSVTHSFIQRYGSGLIFTYASGINLISINPMMPLNIYSEKVMDLFTNCQVRYDMPPHVYSVAQLILARLKRRLFYSLVTMEQQHHLDTNPVYHLPCSLSQQVLCLLGRSGSGKTRISSDVFTYMVHQSEKSTNIFNQLSVNNNASNSSISSKINGSRLRALFNMIDSFTCSRIILNTNGSRALRLFSLEFANIHSVPIVNQPEDINLIVTGLTTRLLLFERSRVTDRPEGEPNFHIFYYMLAGLDEESRRELFLTDLDVPNLFMTRLHRPEDKASAKGFWNQLCHDAEILQFDAKNEWLTGGIARLLAVIYHLGCAGYCHELNEQNMLYFANNQSAQYAAYLLHCSLDTLNELVFNPILRKSTINNHHANSDQYSIKWTAKSCLHAFVQDLYNLIVNILVSLINRCLSTPKSDISSQIDVAAQLILVDPVGFQIPHATTVPTITSSLLPTDNNEIQKSANFTDLIFNYAYECFNQLYFDNLRSIRRFKRNGSTFILNHNLSTTPIEYAPNRNWFAPCHRSAGCKQLKNLLEQSPLVSLRKLVSVLDYKEDYLSSFIPNSSSHIGAYSEVKSVMETLTRSLYDCAAHNASYNPNDPGSGFNDGGPPSGMHWIHCFLPVSTAGLCELKEEIPIDQLIQMNYATNNTVSSNHHNINNSDIDLSHRVNHNTTNLYLSELLKRHPNRNLVCSPARICVNLIRAQIRGIELINTLQGVKQSYPDRLSLKEFCNRFVSLLPINSKAEELKHNESLNKTIVHEILNSLHYSPETFQLGNNNIYLRTFIIPQLVHRLSYSSDLPIEQELIHVQPDCKSFIIDCCDDQMMITEDKITPRILPKHINTVEHSKGTEFHQTSSVLLSDKENTTNKEESLFASKVDDSTTAFRKTSEENLQSIVVGCEKLEPTHKEQQTYQYGSIQLIGSSETIKRRTDSNDFETKNESLLSDKGIYLTNSTYQSSLNIKPEVDSKILIRNNQLNHSLDATESIPTNSTEQLSSPEIRSIQLPLNSLMNNKIGCVIQNGIKETLSSDLTPTSALTICLENNSLNESSDDLIKLKSAYAKALERIKELETVSNDLQCKLSSLAVENMHSKQNCDRARVDLDLAEENRLQAEQQIKVINLKLEQAEKRHVLLLESLKKASEEDAQLASTDYSLLYPNAPEPLLNELYQLRSTIQSLTLQLTDLQNTVVDLKKDLEIAYTNHQKAETTIEKLRTDIIRIQDEHEADYEANRVANKVKLRQLEESLCKVQEENTRLTRDKHQLEMEVSALNIELSSALASSGDCDIEHKLRKELRIIKNLLAEKEALVIELSSNPNDSQAQIKKLRDRIDELDESNEIMNRQKRALQSDLEEIQQQLASSLRVQKELQEELSRSKREVLDLQNQVTDQEEAHKETRDKLQSAMASLTVKEATIQAQIQEIEEFLVERKKLQTHIDELKLKLNTNNIEQVPRSDLERLEAKIRELEQRLEIETSNRLRIQYSLDRARETIDQLTNERDRLLITEANEREQNRKLSRQLREAQQDENEASRRATTAQRRAEEAQLDANKAMHDALCSRAEMNALLRRTQDLEALIKSKQSESDYEDLYGRLHRRGVHQLRFLNRAFSDDNLPYFPNRLSDHLTTTTRNSQSVFSDLSHFNSSVDNNNNNISSNNNAKQHSMKSKLYDCIMQTRSTSPVVFLSNNGDLTHKSYSHINMPISSDDKLSNSSNFASSNSNETAKNGCTYDVYTVNRNNPDDNNVGNDQNCKKTNGLLIFSSNVRVLTSPKFKQTVTIKRVHSDCIHEPNMKVITSAERANNNNNNNNCRSTISDSNRSSIDFQTNLINHSNNSTYTETTSGQITARNESPAMSLSSFETSRNSNQLRKTSLEIFYHVYVPYFKQIYHLCCHYNCSTLKCSSIIILNKNTLTIVVATIFWFLLNIVSVLFYFILFFYKENSMQYTYAFLLHNLLLNNTCECMNKDLENKTNIKYTKNVTSNHGNSVVISSNNEGYRQQKYLPGRQKFSFKKE